MARIHRDVIRRGDTIIIPGENGGPEERSIKELLRDIAIKDGVVTSTDAQTADEAADALLNETYHTAESKGRKWTKFFGTAGMIVGICALAAVSAGAIPLGAAGVLGTVGLGIRAASGAAMGKEIRDAISERSDISRRRVLTRDEYDKYRNLWEKYSNDEIPQKGFNATLKKGLKQLGGMTVAAEVRNMDRKSLYQKDNELGNSIVLLADALGVKITDRPKSGEFRCDIDVDAIRNRAPNSEISRFVQEEEDLLGKGLLAVPQFGEALDPITKLKWDFEDECVHSRQRHLGAVLGSALLGGTLMGILGYGARFLSAATAGKGLIGNYLIDRVIAGGATGAVSGGVVGVTRGGLISGTAMGAIDGILKGMIVGGLFGGVFGATSAWAAEHAPAVPSERHEAPAPSEGVKPEAPAPTERHEPGVAPTERPEAGVAPGEKPSGVVPPGEKPEAPAPTERPEAGVAPSEGVKPGVVATGAATVPGVAPHHVPVGTEGSLGTHPPDGTHIGTVDVDLDDLRHTQSVDERGVLIGEKLQGSFDQVHGTIHDSSDREIIREMIRWDAFAHHQDAGHQIDARVMEYLNDSRNTDHINELIREWKAEHAGDTDLGKHGISYLTDSQGDKHLVVSHELTDFIKDKIEGTLGIEGKTHIFIDPNKIIINEPGAFIENPHQLQVDQNGNVTNMRDLLADQHRVIERMFAPLGSEGKSTDSLHWTNLTSVPNMENVTDEKGHYLGIDSTLKSLDVDARSLPAETVRDILYHPSSYGLTDEEARNLARDSGHSGYIREIEKTAETEHKPGVTTEERTGVTPVEKPEEKVEVKIEERTGVVPVEKPGVAPVAERHGEGYVIYTYENKGYIDVSDITGSPNDQLREAVLYTARHQPPGITGLTDSQFNWIEKEANIDALAHQYHTSAGFHQDTIQLCRELDIKLMPNEDSYHALINWRAGLSSEEATLKASFIERFERLISREVIGDKTAHIGKGFIDFVIEEAKKATDIYGRKI